MKFESYKTEKGNFRWRLREESGKLISVKPGKIMGVTSSPSKKKASERVVDLSLERLAGSGRIVGGKGSPRPRSVKSAKA